MHLILFFPGVLDYPDLIDAVIAIAALTTATWAAILASKDHTP